MLYLYAWNSDDGIVYFRYNVVCKKCRICTLDTRMMGLLIARKKRKTQPHQRGKNDENKKKERQTTTKKKTYLFVMCCFFFFGFGFLHVNYFFKKKKNHLHVNVNLFKKKKNRNRIDVRGHGYGIVYFLHAWHSDDGAIYFRYNVVCKKCRICTLGTRMMGLFIFVVTLFVRSVVSALDRWCDCLFSS